MLHRTRHLFVRQQTAVINAIRAHLAEFGIVAPVGRNGVEELLDVVADPNDDRVPEVARECLAALGAQLRMLKVQVLSSIQRSILAWHRSNGAQAARRDTRASDLRSQPRWWPALPIQGLSDQEEIFGLGGAGAEAELERRQGEARRRHHSAVIDTCAACSRLAP